MSAKCPTCGYEFDPQAAPGLKGACPRCVAELLRSRTGDAAASSPVHEDDAPPLATGQKLRGFEVLEYLGRGGMGFVYKAKQAGLDRVVALKVLAPRLASSPEFAARFEREAKALAALSHPNIVQIFDYGQESGLYFLVMEYVDGTSLRRVLSTQKIEPATALRYVPQICDALEYAHTAGIVHRDIKPENILIDKRGGLKIADFGLAKIAVTSPSPETRNSEPGFAKATPGKPGTRNSELGTRNPDHATVSGQVMGTPHYMAPEQVENMAAVDHRADIYSLGVVFYEMLTGELPLGRFPAPSQRVQVDVRFDEVVLKALEKEPEKRYQRASLVKDDLTRITTGAASVSPPARTLHDKAVNLIERAGVQSSPRWYKVLSLVLLILDIVGMVILCSAIIASKNTFKQMFSEMGVGDIGALPEMTLMFIAIPNVAYVLAVGLAALVLAAKEFVIRRRSVSLGLNALVLIAELGLFSAYVVAMFMPMAQIMEILSKAETAQVSTQSEPAPVSWGQPVNGLQTGLLVKQARFEAGKPMEFKVFCRNVGQAPLNLFRPERKDLWPFDWELVFAPKDARAPRRATPLWAETTETAVPHKQELRPGQTAEESLVIGTTVGTLVSGWQFEDAREVKEEMLRPIEFLPPGKYTVTARFAEPESSKETWPDGWTGRATTGPVEIEIVKPAQPAFRVDFDKSGMLTIATTPKGLTLEQLGERLREEAGKRRAPDSLTQLQVGILDSPFGSPQTASEIIAACGRAGIAMIFLDAGQGLLPLDPNENPMLSKPGK